MLLFFVPCVRAWCAGESVAGSPRSLKSNGAGWADSMAEAPWGGLGCRPRLRSSNSLELRDGWLKRTMLLRLGIGKNQHFSRHGTADMPTAQELPGPQGAQLCGNCSHYESVYCINIVFMDIIDRSRRQRCYILYSFKKAVCL